MKNFKIIIINGVEGLVKQSLVGKIFKILDGLGLKYKETVKIDSKANLDIIYILNNVTLSDLNRFRKLTKKILTIWILANPQQRESSQNLVNFIETNDIVIDNNYQNLPNELEVDLLISLDNTHIVSISNETYIPVTFPQPPINNQKKAITGEDIAKLLNKFAGFNRDNEIFVIQGGNRYIHDYFKKKFSLETHSVKIASINKNTLFIALNTLLASHERLSFLQAKQQKKITLLFEGLENDTRKEIKTRFNKAGFISLENLLIVGTRSEILQIFTDLTVETPFSQESKFQQIKSEFETIDKYLEKELVPNYIKEITKCLLAETNIYNLIIKNRKQLIFVDDVLYRGRTFYTLTFILNLFGVPRERWSLCVLCLHRGTSDKYALGKRINILNKKLTYTFENSPLSESGFWEQTNYYFKFLDINLYFNYVDFITKQINTAKKLSILETWDEILETILKKSEYPKLNKEIPATILELFVYYKSFNLKIDMESLLGQTAKNCGYCIPFVKYLLEYTRIPDIGKRRPQFKNSIKFLIKALETEYENSRSLFDRAISFYRNNYLILDYVYLKNYRDTQFL